MRRFAFALVVVLGAICGFASACSAVEVMVYSAVSLTEALRENATAYAKTSSDEIVFNFGASSTLALQIQAGAPADVFFSADEATMTKLESKHLLLPGTRHAMLSNTLAVVVESGSTLDLHSAADLALPAVRHIALAEPSTVPAGVYAKQYLKGLGLWTTVIDKVVPTENVRATLAAVEAGSCEAGIVYKTDALISKRVQIAFEVPRDQGPNISYPIAIPTSAKQPEAARRFVAFLSTDAARAVFVAHGFLLPGASKP